MRVGSVLFGAIILPAPMGFADVWNRTLVYFGIAEEDDWDEDGYATNEELERSYGARSGRTCAACSRAAAATSTTGPTPSRRPTARR